MKLLFIQRVANRGLVLKSRCLERHRALHATVYDGVSCRTPLEQFSKLDCSTTKRVPIPNDTFPASSGRDVSIADLYGTATTIPTIPTIPTMENRPRGVGYTPSCTVLATLHEYEALLRIRCKPANICTCYLNNTGIRERRLQQRPLGDTGTRVTAVTAPDFFFSLLTWGNGHCCNGWCLTSNEEES